jgi:hypothetical protein
MANQPDAMKSSAPMTEIWLRPNRRVLTIALIPAAVFAAAGYAISVIGGNAAWRWLGWAQAAIGCVLVLGLIGQLWRPRIAYRAGDVLFYLRAGAPVAVPAEVVEAFFLGQGPANLPTVGQQQPETVNLVARLSQKAPEWSHVEVKPALGRWCDGYVTIRGTWCEPLDGEVIRRLNRRLRELREARAGAGDGDAAADPCSESTCAVEPKCEGAP